MGPYAIAHMKVGLKLYETGYCFASHERARIYLTNALEPCMTQIPLIGFDALAHEAAAVNEIKRHTRFTVVIANPPYAVHSANESRDSLGRPTFIGRLIEDYKQVDGKPLREKNPKVIQDDYVKFIRFSQWSISQTGLGIVGMITNHSYLDNLTFRGMRQSLLSSFKDIRVCDLHGNANKKELPPNREIDENVFDIKQGVALFLGLQKLGSALSNHVWHSEMWGTRKTKYEQLVDKSSSTLSTQKLQSLAPFFLFIPQGTAVRSEYEQGIQLAAVFLLNSSCMNTARDHLVIDCSEDVLRERIAWMADPRVSVQEIREKFGIESTGWWSLDEAITALRATPDWRHLIIRCLYRPFDVRWLFHHTAFIDRPRPRANRHMLLGNISLVTTRQTKEPFAAVVTNLICGQHKIAAVYDRSYFFPLFTFQESRDFQPIVTSEAAGRPNLSPAFLGALGTALKLPQEGAYGMPKGLSPEDIFQYAYSVFHSTGYRSRYAELLKIDFPRLPLTRNLHLFCALARLGGELVALHVLASSRLDNFLTSYTGAANPEVEKIFRSGDAVWLDKAQTCGFCGVPQDAWEFHIGGYQVCEKWLKDRKGRTLSAQDIEHYHRIVVALSETIRLMREIDEVIDQHGGWPLA